MKISPERGLSAAIMGTILFDIAAKSIKHNPDYFPHNLRKWASNFTAIAQPVLWRIEKLKKLFISESSKKEFEKEVGYMPEAEEIENDLNIEQELVSKFISLYLGYSTNQMYNLDLYFENLIQGKKLYTEEEVQDIKTQKYAELY